MAEVFRAHDELWRERRREGLPAPTWTPADSVGGRQRQEIELQALARLSHPNLITLFDGSVTDPDGPAYLVMELVDGPSLSARIAEARSRGRSPRDRGPDLDALAYVHAREHGAPRREAGQHPGRHRCHHRRRQSGRGCRTSASCGCVGSERLTSADFMVGTASYLAPEQARGAEVGPAADVYALGLVLLEALTGGATRTRSATGGGDGAAGTPAGRYHRACAQPWSALLTAIRSSSGRPAGVSPGRRWCVPATRSGSRPHRPVAG